MSSSCNDGAANGISIILATVIYPLAKQLLGASWLLGEMLIIRDSLSCGSLPPSFVLIVVAVLIVSTQVSECENPENDHVQRSLRCFATLVSAPSTGTKSQMVCDQLCN